MPLFERSAAKCRTPCALQLFVLCCTLACLGAFASIDRSDGDSLTKCMASLGRDGIIGKVAQPNTLTNLDVLMANSRERAVASPTSDADRVQLAWLYGLRARQAVLSTAPGDAAERQGVAAKWARQGIGELREAVRLNPRNGRAWHLMVTLQWGIGDIEEAITNCQTAIAIDANALDFVMLARLLNLKDRYPEALAAGEQALARDPLRADAWIETGVARAKVGRPTEACRAADEALRLLPDNGFVLQQAGRIYRYAHRLPESDALLLRADATEPDQAETYCLQARNACDLERYDEATNKACAALHLESGHSEAINVIGRVFSERGQHEKAMEYFRAALRCEPKSRVYLCNLAESLELLERFPEAEAAYRRAYELNPGVTEALDAVTGYLERRGKEEGVIALLQEAQRGGQTNGIINGKMGSSLLRLGRPREALPYLEQALTDNPKDDKLLARKAMCAGQIGDREQCIAAWHQAIDGNPTNVSYRGALGGYLSRIGDRSGAEAVMREAIRACSSDTAARVKLTFGLAGILLAQGRAAAAQEEVERVRASDPTNKMVVLMLADCYLGAGNARAADESLRRAVLTQPDDPDLWGKLAQVNLVLNPSEAAKCAQRALAICPTNFMAHYALGKWYSAFQHDTPAALASYEAAARAEPKRSEPYISLGILLAKAGDLDASETNFAKALTIAPADANLLTSYGYLRYQRHDYTNAIAYLERAIAADPRLGLAHYNLALACLKTGSYDKGIAHCHKAKETGYPCDDRLLKELEQGRLAVESSRTISPAK